MRIRDLFEKFVYLFVPQLRLFNKSVKASKFAYNAYERYKKFKQTNMRLSYKVGIGSVSAFLFIIIFGFIAFPKILKGQIKNQVSLKKGNDVREMYLKVPFPLVFKLYIFNVTNPTEIAERGSKPLVKEIGPYIFDEWKEKVDIEDNEEEDTMDYTIKNTFVFNEKLSAPLTGNEVITMIHPMIAGLSMVVAQDKPGALSLLNKAINSIYSNPEHPFLHDTVMNIMFNGVLIYCNVTDFAGKAVCTQLKTEAKDLEEVEPNILKFSLFGAKNGTKQQRMKVKRGIENIRDLGRVIEFEGQTHLEMWDGEPCNTYEGTDSTIFPPFLTEEEGLISFAPDLCMSLKAFYVENSKYAGLPVRKYSANFGDMSTVPEQKCLCPSAETCYKKGVVSLKPCIGAPIIASLPHFYQADPSYLNAIVGLNPNEKDHEIIIFFESITGSPVSAKKRMQFNMEIQPIAKINAMKNMPDVVFPLFWVEEGIDLNKTWTGQLNNQLFRMLKIMKIIKYLVLVGSILGMAAAGYLHFNKKVEVQITPVHVQEGEQKRKDVISMLSQQKPNYDGGHVNHAMSNNEIDKY